MLGRFGLDVCEQHVAQSAVTRGTRQHTEAQGGAGLHEAESSCPAHTPIGWKLLRAPPCQPTGAWLSCCRPPSSSTNARVVWQLGGTSSAVQRTSWSMQASVSCSGTS